MLILCLLSTALSAPMRHSLAFLAATGLVTNQLALTPPQKVISRNPGFALPSGNKLLATIEVPSSVDNILAGSKGSARVASTGIESQELEVTPLPFDPLSQSIGEMLFISSNYLLQALQSSNLQSYSLDTQEIVREAVRISDSQILAYFVMGQHIGNYWTSLITAIEMIRDDLLKEQIQSQKSRNELKFLDDLKYLMQEGNFEAIDDIGFNVPMLDGQVKAYIPHGYSSGQPNYRGPQVDPTNVSIWDAARLLKYLTILYRNKETASEDVLDWDMDVRQARGMLFSVRKRLMKDI